MSDRSGTYSVLFFKRMIAAVLALIIVTLTGLSIWLGVGLHRTKAALSDAEAREEERLAAEEAERLRNELPPEREKPAGEPNAADILAGSRIIAHALGGVDGIAGLNCLEGFRAAYDAGVRVFEADLRMTADGAVVLRHDWSAGVQEGISAAELPTLDKFLSVPVGGTYTPLSFHDLLLLMSRYPDICVVTDTKLMETEAVAAQFRAMVSEARAQGLSYLFDRMVVQVYSAEHFATVNGVYHFPYYIYTLYQDPEGFGKTEDAFRQKAIFCEENGIMGITLADSLWDSDYAPIAEWRNLRVFVHTVNSADRARSLFRNGVSAVYTDFLTPGELAG